MRVLVTGGTGFIGSHTVVELLSAKHEVAIVDNLSNSKASVIDRIERICGVRPDFERADIRDRGAMAPMLGAGNFDGVMHFAGLKAVDKSMAQPLAYYDNDVCGSLVLLDAMASAGAKQLVFSSSATFYGASAVQWRMSFAILLRRTTGGGLRCSAISILSALMARA